MNKKYLQKGILATVMCMVVLNTSTVTAKNKNHAIPLNSSQIPWRSIGILTYNDKKCVATVVDNNVILTSAYCLLDDNGQELASTQKLTFQAGYKDKFYIAKAHIMSFVTPRLTSLPNNFLDMHTSWAFLFTQPNIAATTKFINIYKYPITPEFLNNHKIITVGYNEKEENGLFASIKCSFVTTGIEGEPHNNDNPAVLLQNCEDDFYPLLGSPVISIDHANNIKIIGIVSGRIKHNEDNVNIVVTMSGVNNNNASVDNHHSLQAQPYDNQQLKSLLK